MTLELENAEFLPPEPCPCGSHWDELHIFTLTRHAQYTPLDAVYWSSHCGISLPNVNGAPAKAAVDKNEILRLEDPSLTRCACSSGKSPGFEWGSDAYGRPAWLCQGCRLPLGLAVIVGIADRQNADRQNAAGGAHHHPHEPDPEAQARRAERERLEAESKHTCPVCKTHKLLRRPAKTAGRFWWGCAGFPKCSARFSDADGKPGKPF